MCFLIIDYKSVGCHVVSYLTILLGERVREGSWVRIANTKSSIIHLTHSPTTLTIAGLGCLVVNRVLVYKVRNIIGK